MNMIKGIDVSIYQGNIDWNKVAESDYKFAIIRCAIGNSSKDKNFDKNLAGAKAAGLKVMVYHFLYPLPSLRSPSLRDPKAQAKLHADWAQGELAAADLEWPDPSTWAKWGCSAKQIIDWTITYLEEYERLTGIRCLVYTYNNFANSIHLPDSFGEKYKLWIASYTTNPVIPEPWKDWAMWQINGGTHKLSNGLPVDEDLIKDFSLWEQQPVPPSTVNNSIIETVVNVSDRVSSNAPVVMPLAQPTSLWQAFFNLFKK